MSLPEPVFALLKTTFLSGLADQQLRELFEHGMHFDIPRGTVAGRPEDTGRVALITSGIFRMYYSDISGKAVTIRYAGPGEFMGLPAMVGGPVDLTVDCILEKAGAWVIPSDRFKHACQNDTRLGWLLTEEITRRLYGVLNDRMQEPFLNLRDRLVKHLSMMADCQGSNRPVFLKISQQTLADAVGSSREAVARTLRELREDEIVATSNDGLSLLR